LGPKVSAEATRLVLTRLLWP